MITRTLQLVLSLGPLAIFPTFAFAQSPGGQAAPTSKLEVLGFALVLLVLGVAGLGGGYAGYLLGPPDPAELRQEKRTWLLRRSLVSGVVASYLMPLFLSLAGAASGASGQLVNKLIGSSVDYSAWLVLIGFCLAAAVSAPKFILAVSNKFFQEILDEAKNASEKADAAREKVEELDEDFVENQKAVARQEHGSIADDVRTVLSAIYRSDERRPTFDDIRKALRGMSEKKIQDALKDLEERGLAKSRIYDDGERRWRVRTAGKALLGLSMGDSGSGNG